MYKPSMACAERKQSLRSDESVWRYLRILVGQLVSARTVVGELIKKQAMDEEAQDMFVSVVLHDEHLQAHPPSSKYLKTLLQLYARGNASGLQHRTGKVTVYLND